MNIYITILLQFLIISSCILFLFRLRDRLGLAPMYILLGSLQYIQALYVTMNTITVFESITVYPASVIVFCAVLFAVLLIYIKEGVASARALIIGVIVSNVIISILFSITYTREILVQDMNGDQYSSVVLMNYKYFLFGTFILLIDFLLLVVIYQFLIFKIKKSFFFLVLFISLFITLLFDSLVFNLVLRPFSANFIAALISHIAGKSVSALVFSVILYIYLKYIDKATKNSSFIAKQNRDIFSIIKYRKRYFDLKVEKELSEERLRFQLEVTLDNISDGFISVDTDWNYVYVNKKAAEILGKSPENLIGKNIWKEFPRPKESPFYKNYIRALKTQQTVYFEEYNKQSDKWFENRVYPSSDGLTIYFTDITNKKKADADNQALLSLIETSDDFVGLATLEGKPLYLNANGRELVSLNFDEELPKSIADFFPDKYTEKIEKEHLPTIYEKNKWSGEAEFRNFKTGNLIPIEISGFLIRDKSTQEPMALGIVASDVTERKLAEKEIEEIQGKLEAAIRIGKIGYWSWDIKKDIVYWSDLMFEIYDVDKNTQLNYNSVLNSVHPEDKDFHNNITSERIKTKSNEPFEYRILWRDKTIKYVMVQIEVVEDELGNAIKFQGTVIDVTKLKEAEEQIIKSEKYLDNIINNIGDPVFVKDSQSRLLLVNSSFCKIFELQKDDIIGKTLAEDVPPHERENFLRIDKHVIDTGIENINEETLTVRGGESKTILTKKTRFIDNKGKVFLIGIIRDISDRKNFERKIRTSNDRFEMIARATSDIIWDWDLNTNKVWWNDNYYSQFGYPRKGSVLDVDSWYNGLHPDDKDKVVNGIHRSIENMEQFWKEEYRFLKSDGTPTYIFDRGYIIYDDDNKPHRMVGAMQDITDRKKTEIELKNHKNNLEALVESRTSELEKEKVKAQSADLMKSAFLATMSHELRTPMNSIIGFTGILLKELAGPLNEEQKKQLSMVKNSGEHLLGLINDVLDISKIEAGKLNVSLYPFDYISCLEKTTEFLLPQASKKGLDIKTEISAKKIALVSDERRVEQILLNLLSNAIKFSKKGTITVKANVEDNFIITQVIDQGIGISKNNLVKLFMPFIQLEGGLSRSHEGTGLGLAICKNLIEKLGGTINVESKLGKGSNFTFKLPLEYSK